MTAHAASTPTLMQRSLADSDPDIARAIANETARQAHGLELIASENFVSTAVLEAAGSVFTNKYAEGYPGRRYYGGCEQVDIVESLAIARAKALFGAEHANVQPHSGAQANMTGFLAALKPGDNYFFALLKAEGRFAALPVVASRAMRLGSTVATVGFPNVGLQGFAPKLARGEIAALSGAQDDARHFQISVPVQPGNSGGALVDERGNVVGVVAAKMSARAALAASGALPENVNYAVKSSFLLSFLESVPEVSAKLKEANTKERKFEDVVKSAEQAAVLVLVY